jgi:hypothetical protein
MEPSLDPSLNRAQAEAFCLLFKSRSALYIPGRIEAMVLIGGDSGSARCFMAAGVASCRLKEEAAPFLVQAVPAVAEGKSGWFSQRIQIQMSQILQMERTTALLIVFSCERRCTRQRRNERKGIEAKTVTAVSAF